MLDDSGDTSSGLDVDGSVAVVTSDVTNECAF